MSGLVIIAVLSVLRASAGEPEYDVLCLADPGTGDVEVTSIRRMPGRDWTMLDENGRWSSPDLDGRPEAAGLDWYRSGRPIARDGGIYRPVKGTWSAGGAVNRYFRHVGLHEGAPLFSFWPGGDIDLAVLVRQKGCVFHIYAREEEAED